MYLYTLELPNREGPKGHPTFVEGGRTYMVQFLPHTRTRIWPGPLILNFLNNVSLKTFGLQSVGLDSLGL